MPPLLKPLQKRSEQRPTKRTTVSACVARVYVRPSRFALTLQLGIGAIAIYATWQTAPPEPLMLLVCAWILLCLVLAWWQRHPWHELHDEGETWLLVTANGAERVTRRANYFRSAHLVVLSFRNRAGHVRHVGIWRDAVTPAAFSWLHARLALTHPDTDAEFVATSTPGRVFNVNESKSRRNS